MRLLDATPKAVHVFVSGLIPLWFIAMTGLIATQNIVYSYPFMLWSIGFCVYAHFDLKVDNKMKEAKE